MTDKQKIADLEKRVKDLEVRPQAPTIIVLPALTPIPVLQPLPVFPPPRPWWEWPVNICAGSYPEIPKLDINTCGAAGLESKVFSGMEVH
jgi:hypothetical protein